MVVNKPLLFQQLFNNFLEVNRDVVAIIISDYEGLIIAAEKRKDIDIELISVLTAIVNPILERLRNEFSFKRFGSASFDTDEYRILFISIDERTILNMVSYNMASIDKLTPYGYFLAEKSAQILAAEEGDLVQVSVPNFEYESQESEKLKEQIYQLRLDSGGKYRFKFVIVGDHEVGKTSIVRRFVEKKFLKDYRATIGINILAHTIEFFGNEINLSLWDVGAQEYFKRFRKTYYSGAQAAFIVFDLTLRKSFNNVKIWHDELKEFIGKKDLPIVIVGNKFDLVDQRQVNFQEGVQLAGELSNEKFSRISYIETSALTGENVEDAFSLISYHYIMKSKEMEEKRLQDDLFDELSSILESKGSLTLSIIDKTPFWNPVLQILTEINASSDNLNKLGFLTKLKDDKEEKIYHYSSGLIIKSYLYDSFDVSDADGVFCIFDAREKENIDPIWREIVIKIIDKVQENKVILIGIRVTENVNWSRLMEEFNINEQLENKMVSLLFFKIGVEYQLEIYDELKIMLSTIKSFP